MNKTRGYAIALVSLITAVIACDSSGPPTESPKILTATPVVTSAPTSASATEAVSPNTPAATSGAAATATTAASATVEPTATSAPIAYLGDVVEVGGYSFSVVAVEDPATPSSFYQKQEGNRLVAVQVIFGNVDGDVESSNPYNITLLDVDGFSYQPDVGARDGQITLASLQKGERVKGWVAFQVPTAAVLKKVRYALSRLSDVVLQVNLDAPPAGHSPLVGTPRTTPVLPKLGDTVQQGGYSLSAITVEDPAKAGLFYTPQKDSRLIAVQIAFGNDAGAKITANPLSAYLVDTDGFVYPAELGGRDGQLALVDLGPGDKVKGWVSFTLPKTAVAESVKYQLDIFSGLELNTGLLK